MIQKAPSDMNFVERELQVEKLWRDREIFKKTVDQRKDSDVFTFYDGPPTANGKPHIGHIETRAIKDLIPRFQTMKGKSVLRKAGWDTHGLPVELEVEKQLGLDGKEQIEKYGIEPFIQKCKESVWKYKGEWERMSERVGFWADMEDPYITYKDSYIESEWWSLKQIAEKGLLYKGHKVVPYCPRCGTALSSHEVAQGYKSVKEKSAFVRFRVKGEKDSYLYAWTTTPWTLPSNVALCVGADYDYAKFRFEGRTVIMAQALIESVLGAEDAARIEILATVKGRDLIGMEYEPLFDFQRALVDKPAFRVVADDYVTLTDGTGIVHIAPAFGEDDARVGRENGLPFLQLVTPKGEMDPATPWGGVFVKKADPLVLKDLEARGLLVGTRLYEHDYPFCWRCDTPLIYYARSTWFIRVTALKDELQKSNYSVNWMPANIKEGRMGDFIENVIDWGLSRERYWGTPLPVWICADCGHIHVIGSRAELEEMGENVPKDLELHRPYIDRIEIKCPKCAGVMRRTPEVIDCWYDSGSMPFAQWHYPFENKETFEKRFPADFISEAIDQTRGWFYSLLAISTLNFGCAPFKNCLVLGHVQDAEGRKMSKHLGNVVDPWSVLDKQGADAVRWYFYASGAPWLPSRFSSDLVSDMQRKFLGTLWNTYAFFTLYASIDGYDPAKKADPKDFTLMDKWVLSKLQTLIETVDQGLENYKITETARAIAAFTDELSNWYVRRSRERFWGKGLEGDKLSAFETLYTVLTTLAGVTAPYIPFMAETIYQNLVVNANAAGAKESVHLTDFPAADKSLVNEALERDMEEVIRIVSLGRACRQEGNMKVRQPAAALYVKGSALPENMVSLIVEELNVKKLVFVEDARAFTGYLLKPQMRTLGPRYGKLLGKIGQKLKELDGNTVVDAFARGETVSFEIDGTEVTLAKDDVLTEPTQKPGYLSQAEGGLVVALDSNLTEQLIEEGFVRETISKVQTMRKESGFEVTDRILIRYRADEKLSAILERGKDTVMKAVLSLSMESAEPRGVVREWSVNGLPMTIGLEKAEI